MESEKKRYPLRTLIWVLLVIGFMIMEFPGVFFLNRIEPMIFGMPFIYSFTIIMWAIMCVIVFVGYKTNWGKGASFVENPDAQD
jgi:undecaprenyl pyrophosphate phosphatase UppP